MSTEVTPKDEFATAFAQFGADETPAETPPADETPVDETPADETPADETPAETPPADETPSDETPAETPPADETPADEPQTASDDELLARLAALVKKAPVEAAPPAATEPETEPDIYSAEEQAFLSEYEKDWPDVAKAESLRRRAEYRTLVNHVFSEVAKELGPIAQTLRTLAERTHLTDIHEKVEDYDDVRDKVIDWVEKQPNYLQTAYKQVIQHGTPDEIADLVTRYKTETGLAAPAVQTRKTESELPTTTKQAVAALAPVSSKRSTVVQADDPNDFEGAFRQFAKTL